METLPSPEGRPLVLAHRGASADAPENTLEAFREAVRQGADGVELDVMVCATGEVVVCHDEWLDRLAGEHLEVLRTPFERLRSVDVGSRFSSRFAGERIPTLAEVFAVLPAGMLVNVELKCETARDHGLTASALRVIAADQGRHEIVLSSFNPLCLARVRLLAPRSRVGLLFESGQPPVLRSGRLAPLLATSSIHPEHGLCSKERVGRWHRQGLQVLTWTVDAPADVERCCRAGVDGLITNRPAATLALARRYSRA